MAEKIKPQAEDAVTLHLDGETAQSALDFIEFMKENKMSLKHTSGRHWKASYKSKGVCYMLIDENGWILRFSQFTRERWFVDYEHCITDAGLKEFILSKINPRNCPDRDCGISRNKMILGKTFDEVCTCWPLYLKNLDGEDLANIKKFVLVIKQFIAELAV
ncbi:MAG: hypothetical protein FWE06_06135 [Oscillospiraceae bacterium]|nr:hypothetical protein [Oscillospiraceae bacterium]